MKPFPRIIYVLFILAIVMCFTASAQIADSVVSKTEIPWWPIAFGFMSVITTLIGVICGMAWASTNKRVDTLENKWDKLTEEVHELMGFLKKKFE